MKSRIFPELTLYWFWLFVELPKRFHWGGAVYYGERRGHLPLLPIIAKFGCAINISISHPDLHYQEDNKNFTMYTPF